MPQWLIHITPQAREMIRTLDESTKEELRDHAALLCDEPMSRLRRSTAADPLPDLLIDSYDSAARPGERVSLYFTRDRLNEHILVLVGLFIHAIDTDPTDEV